MATIRLNCIPGDDEIVERALKTLTSDAVGDKQHWIGVAGGPGAGKSTFVVQLVRLLNEKCGEGTAIGVGMDGFHFSRAQLSKVEEESDGKYTFESLIRRRGSPWTFDVKYLIAKLQLLRSEREGSCPVYSRQLSDPVEGGIALRKTNRIVIVEGNYLFNFDDPDWVPLRELFDDRWFLSCESMAVQRQRLVRRHLETWTEEKTRMWGGTGEEAAGRKADDNDVLNAIFVEENTKRYGQFFITSLDTTS